MFIVNAPSECRLMLDVFSDSGAQKFTYAIDDAIAIFTYRLHHIVKIKLPDNCVDIEKKNMKGIPNIQFFEKYRHVHKQDSKKLPGHGLAFVECNKPNGNVYLTYTVDMIIDFVMNSSFLNTQDYGIEFNYKCYFNSN